jgi:uncharacterized protein YndB with AHSA1/START domain
MPISSASRVQRQISATPERVWTLLTDARGYPTWNPAVRSIEGTIADGEKIIVHFVGSGRAFRARVTSPASQDRWSQFHPTETSPAQTTEIAGNSMEWRSGIPGLLSHTRTFTVNPTGDGVVLVIDEFFSGPVMSLRFMERVTSETAESMADWAENLHKAATN